MRVLVATFLLVLVLTFAGHVQQVDAKQKIYYEVADLMGDIGFRMCKNLARLIKGRGDSFKPHRRCDLFQEVIEDLGGMTDQMAKEMDLTQQDLVDTAQRFPHFFQLQMNLKKAAKKMLAKKQPTEKMIQQELNADMSQWILHIAIGQTGDNNGMDKLDKHQQKNLRNMGVKVPGNKFLDDDVMDDEDYLLDDGDKTWANEQEDKEEDDEDDDDDEDDPLLH